MSRFLLKNLRKSVARVNDVTELRSPTKDDVAVISYRATIDGKDFEGGKANNVVLELAQNGFPKEMNDALLGMKAGESKNVEVHFAQECSK